MPTEYTPSATHHTTISIPDDSTDDCNSTRWGTPLEQLADNVTDLRQPAVSATEKYVLAGRMITRCCHGPTWKPGMANFDMLADGSVQMQQPTSVAAEQLFYEFDPPDGSTLISAQIGVDPAMHATSLPTMPKLRISVYNHFGALITSWEAADPSADVAHYNLAHGFEVDTTGDPVVARASYRYVVTYEHEYGTNYEQNGIVYVPTFTCMVTRQDPGGA